MSLSVDPPGVNDPKVLPRKKLSPSTSRRGIKPSVQMMAGLYDLQETLGKGHYATVKAARHVFTGERVAVKVIDKSKLDEASQKSLLKEVLCMKLVQHPNVVRLYEVIDTSTKLFLVLELGNGDLYDLITKGGGLDESTARFYFTQIVAAVSYCHKLHVVHRDLKPENVVFFQQPKIGILKLTDFGFSNKFCPGVKLDTSCGSLAYSAPEILLGDSYDPPAVDIWSLGVILYMLIVGSPPFQEANDSETLTMIMDVKYTIPLTVSKDCKDLIQLMLQKDPKDRASLEMIEGHDWMERKKKSVNPLLTKHKITGDEKNGIIQEMIAGNIADKESVLESLENNAYNYITSTFYLLAEKLLRERDEQIEDQITGSMESLGPNSNNTRRRRSSLTGGKSIENETIEDMERFNRTSISCSSGLTNKMSNFEEEEESPEKGHRSRETIMRSISSTSSDDELIPRRTQQKIEDSSTSSGSSINNKVQQVPLATEEEECKDNNNSGGKKKSNKLINWLKNLTFKNNNNNKIYKTKSCSELKFKFLK